MSSLVKRTWFYHSQYAYHFLSGSQKRWTRHYIFIPSCCIFLCAVNMVIILDNIPTTFKCHSILVRFCPTVKFALLYPLHHIRHYSPSSVNSLPSSSQKSPDSPHSTVCFIRDPRRWLFLAFCVPICSLWNICYQELSLDGVTSNLMEEIYVVLQQTQLQRCAPCGNSVHSLDFSNALSA